LVCTRGSDTTPLTVTTNYCVLVINPNAFASYGHVVVTFDKQTISTTPVVSTSTTPGPSPTTPSASTKPSFYYTTITVPAGSSKITLSLTNAFVLGLGWIFLSFGKFLLG
jgi:hypothetical protein